MQQSIAAAMFLTTPRQSHTVHGVPELAAQSHAPPPPVRTDEQLVASARAGDERAFEEIVARYARVVERLVRRFFGPGPDHPDLCQEVFLRLFRRLSELRNDAALRGFIVSIALGVSRNELRRARLRRFVGLDDGDRDLPPLATARLDEEAHEAALHLYRMLETLSAEDRSLFVARYIEKLEMADVASVHGLTLGTAKRRVARLADRVNKRMRRDPALSEYVERLTRSGQAG